MVVIVFQLVRGRPYSKMGLLALYIALFAAFSNVSLAAFAPTTSLNDGNKIPILALGTYGGNGEQMRQTINWAVEAGYRHIDTASLYGNEADIGKGIADVISRGLVKREDLFVTTKLWNDKHGRHQVVPALRESLERLGLNYVDLYLIHSPAAENPDGSVANIDYLETWEGMQEAKRLGLAKSIGVSNFDADQIKRIIDNSPTPPAVNQIEKFVVCVGFTGGESTSGWVPLLCQLFNRQAVIRIAVFRFEEQGMPVKLQVHPANTREELIATCYNLGVVVMAYSPFGFLVNRGQTSVPPPQIDNPVLKKIAAKYGKSTPQVVLRYLIERGAIPIPKSVNKARLEQNINIFDFKLTPEEVATISKFNVNRGVFD